MAVLCVVGMSSFVACSDDDDPIAPPVVSENGSYTGTMSYEAPEAPTAFASATADVTFEATQNSIGQDSIVFAKFPAVDIANAVMSGAGALLTEDIRYAFSYTATENSDKTEISIATKPSPLTLNLTAGENPMVVKIFVSSLEKGKYVVASKEMSYALIADSVHVNGATFPFTAMTLNFKGVKK